MTRDELQRAAEQAGCDIDRRLLLAIFHMTRGITRDESLLTASEIACYLRERLSPQIQDLIRALESIGETDGADETAEHEPDVATINDAFEAAASCACDPRDVRRTAQNSIASITIEAARRWATGPLEVHVGVPAAPLYVHVQFAPRVLLRGVASPAVCIIPCDSAESADLAMRRWMEAPVTRQVALHDHPPVNSPSLLRFLERTA
jgi:hypothetical protein